MIKPSSLQGADSNSAAVLYQEDFSEPTALDSWLVEGIGEVHVTDNALKLQEVSDGRGITVWLNHSLPDTYIIDFDLQFSNNRGIGVFFFSANDEALNLPASSELRDGTYAQYTKGKVSCYAVSLHRFFPDGRHNPGSNLRQNPGFHLLNQSLPDPVFDAERSYSIRIVKEKERIKLSVDGNVVHDLEIPFEELPLLGEGYFGVRLRGDVSCIMSIGNVSILNQ